MKTAGESVLQCRETPDEWVEVLPGWFWKYMGECTVPDDILKGTNRGS